MIDDPLSLGTQYRLGTHRATYKPPTISRMTWVMIGLSIIYVVICIIGLLERSNSVYLDVRGQPSLSVIIVYALVCTAVGIAVYVPLFVYRVIRNRTLRLFVYDDGLIHVWHASLQAIYWQNVQAVWHDVIAETHSEYQYTPSYRHVYIVSCTDGTKITLGKTDYEFDNMKQLVKSIEGETARYLFPAVLNTYQVGQPVVFGPLTVTQEGLSHGSDMLLWSEVKSIKIETSGRIVIGKQGKRSNWASVKLGDVPNVEVFKMLVHHITGHHIFSGESYAKKWNGF
jgi:hypothetical protein